MVVAVSWDWQICMGRLRGATQRVRKAEQGGTQEVSSAIQFSSGTNMLGAPVHKRFSMRIAVLY